MFGIGLQELFVLFMLLFLLSPIILTVLLRKYFPNRLWIGVLLCLYSPAGLFYIKGGLKYFISLAIVYVILRALIGSDIYLLIFTNTVSALLMYIRFLQRTRQTIQV